MLVLSRHTLLPLLLTSLALCAMVTPAITSSAWAVTPGSSADNDADNDAASSGRRLSPRARRALRRRKLTQDLARKGEAELRKSVRVFQQRYLVKSKRVELLFGGSTSIGDPLIATRNLDAGLLVHLSNSWAVGATGFYSFAQTKDTFESIQTDFGLFPERSMLQAGGFAELQYSPIFGKFSSFGMAVLQMDAYLIAAGGAIRTTIGVDVKPAWQVGAGLRIHTLRFLTLSFEIRDMMFIENFQAGDRLMQQWFGGLKIGLWIPPTFDYKYQR